MNNEWGKFLYLQMEFGIKPVPIFMNFTLLITWAIIPGVCGIVNKKLVTDMISNDIRNIQNISEAERLAVLLAEFCHELKSDIACEKVAEPPFRIADGEKGTVAQLLWLLAKVAPITDKNGNYITNTEAAAKEMGIALFGESFSNWPQTLHAAFDREKGFDFEKKIQKVIDEKKDSMR